MTFELRIKLCVFVWKWDGKDSVGWDGTGEDIATNIKCRMVTAGKPPPPRRGRKGATAQKVTFGCERLRGAIKCVSRQLIVKPCVLFNP